MGFYEKDVRDDSERLLESMKRTQRRRLNKKELKMMKTMGGEGQGMSAVAMQIAKQMNKIMNKEN